MAPRTKTYRVLNPIDEISVYEERGFLEEVTGG